MFSFIRSGCFQPCLEGCYSLMIDEIYNVRYTNNANVCLFHINFITGITKTDELFKMFNT